MATRWPKLPRPARPVPVRSVGRSPGGRSALVLGNRGGTSRSAPAARSRDHVSRCSRLTTEALQRAKLPADGAHRHPDRLSVPVCFNHLTARRAGLALPGHAEQERAGAEHGLPNQRRPPHRALCAWRPVDEEREVGVCRLHSRGTPDGGDTEAEGRLRVSARFTSHIRPGGRVGAQLPDRPPHDVSPGAGGMQMHTDEVAELVNRRAGR